MKIRLLASVASTALIAHAPSLRAETATPNLADVYKMVVELKAD